MSDESVLSAENVAKHLDSETLTGLATNAMVILADMRDMSQDERSRKAATFINTTSIVIGVFQQVNVFGFYVVKGLRLLQQDKSVRGYGFPCGSLEEAKDMSRILGDGQVLH